MAKVKGIRKALEKFNEANQTARIFLDKNTLKIECRLYIKSTDGRFDYRHSNEVEIISKEVEYGDCNFPKLSNEELLQKINNELE